jgi:imidazolonepropionase-like amidohydrolase
MEGVLSEEQEFPRQLAEALARRDTIVVPRLARLVESPLHLARGLRHVRTLKENKVRLASFGDKDSVMEWRLLSQAGLTPRQILETATVHAAEVAHSHRETGSLRAGYLANLWILRNDPLVDSAHLASVEGIMQQGAWQRRTGQAA